MREQPRPAPVPAGAERAVRVLVVADVRMYREGLALALRADPGVEVVAALAQAPSDLLALSPDVVLFDVSRSHALETVRSLLGDPSAVKVVVVAISEQEGDVLAYAEAGVSGYVTCEQSVDDVVRVVKAVAHGEMICTPRMAATLVRHVATLAAGLRVQAAPAKLPLTRRELEILGLIDRGMSNKQIARAVQIEVATVKNHVHNILEKLRVQRRGEAAAHLRRHGLPQLPPGSSAPGPGVGGRSATATLGEPI